MIRNYMLVAIRNLARNKFFSAINIFGLAISMSVCMAIIMLIADQMRYDRHNSSRKRIYRINSYAVDAHGNDRSGADNATSPMTLREELLKNYPGIASAVRIKRGFGNGWLEFENQDVNIPLKGFFADQEALALFQYELQHGNPETALKEPYSVVLTRAAADKLFREENPLGQTIKVGDVGTYTVTGVLKETDNKSHIVFEALASMSSVTSLQAQGKFTDEMDSWLDFWNGWTYILLEEKASAADILPYLDRIYQQHIATAGNPGAYKAKLRLQNISAITPGPLINNPVGPSLPWPFVYFLGGVSAVIMLTSCFNFTNLSLARSLKRAREIGVRKATGAARWQIFVQFLSESVVISFCSLFIAMILLIVLKPLMLQLTFARIFMWDLAADTAVFGVFVAFALAVGIFAGLFPAIVLSSFQPVNVLKDLSNVRLFSKMGLRKTLLVAQFTISLIFILTVIVMYNQLELFMTRDYGFNMKENIMIRMNGSPAHALKPELLKYSNITNVSAASHVPASGTTYGSGFKKDMSEKEWTGLNYFSVDGDYLKNIEVELVAGKFFAPENGDANRTFAVINEQAVKALRYPTPLDALGQEIVHQTDSSRKIIIGVVRDYHHVQLMNKLEPMALLYNPDQYRILQVRYTGPYDEAVSSISNAWSAIHPNLKIDHRVFEAEIKYFYNTVFGDFVDILGMAAFMAILISCLGLLGMATYTIETRMKEIAVRKVLGSSDGALVLLLSKAFMKLLVVSIFIGVPAAWFINSLWLEHIAYHTRIGPGVILLGTGLLFLFGAITVGSQTFRAAFINPADNLRND